MAGVVVIGIVLTVSKTESKLRCMCRARSCERTSCAERLRALLNQLYDKSLFGDGGSSAAEGDCRLAHADFTAAATRWSGMGGRDDG